MTIECSLFKDSNGIYYGEKTIARNTARVLMEGVVSIPL